jgi:hypothetical protein
LSLENQLAQTKLEIERGVKSIARGAICDAEVDAVMPNLHRPCERPEANSLPRPKVVARQPGRGGEDSAASASAGLLITLANEPQAT